MRERKRLKKMLFLGIALAVAAGLLLLFWFTGANLGYEEEYSFARIEAHTDLSATLGADPWTIQYVYEDTSLKLFADGEWIIDTPLFFSLYTSIDKGQFTVTDDVYTLEGFDYGVAAYGEKTASGFAIAVYTADNTKVCTIHYK